MEFGPILCHADRMRRFLIFCSLLLAACSPGAVQNLVNDSLTVTLEKTVVEDELATVHTKAVLRLRGALNESIDLGDILGELMVVDPKVHPQYQQANGDVVAVLTSWWARQGEEIFITEFDDPHAFTVEHRYGDEEGNCTPPGLIADLPLPGDVTISLEGFDPTAEQSSIQFCHEQKE